MSTSPPALIIPVNNWTLCDQPTRENQWSWDERMRRIAEAGFDAISCPSDIDDLPALLKKHGLRFCGAFEAAREEQFKPRIAACMAIDNGPINCQLADHDTPVEEGIRLTIALMSEAERQGAHVHLEVHRDTCTETPEKAYAIAEGVKKATGRYPLMNFDFSHPAILKHLDASNYAERLFENIPLFQQSRLWHMRPFNGHHCQVPVTDGRGNFSPEYEDMRPFIRTALSHWLDGPRPGNALWVMPELGPKGGYGISCFPNSWEDAIVLGHDIRKIWNELVDA